LLVAIGLKGALARVSDIPGVIYDYEFFDVQL